MNISDPIDGRDSFQITFPNNIVPIYQNIMGTNSLASNPTVTVTGQTALIQPSNNLATVYQTNTQFIIVFENIRSPPSTKRSLPIIVSLLRNGYPKMRGEGTIQAAPS